MNEQGTDELKFSLSYVRKDGGIIPFTKRWGVDGKSIKLPNDITYKVNVSLKDTKEDQRIVDGTQVTTSGNYNPDKETCPPYAAIGGLCLILFIVFV